SWLFRYLLVLIPRRWFSVSEMLMSSTVTITAAASAVSVAAPRATPSAASAAAAAASASKRRSSISRNQPRSPSASPGGLLWPLRSTARSSADPVCPSLGPAEDRAVDRNGHNNPPGDAL